MTFPTYDDGQIRVDFTTCLESLAGMADNSVDSIVTDPPYGLSNTKPELVAEAIKHWVTGDRAFIPDGKGFMGKDWDAFVPPPAVWDECMRVLKPGGHLLAFAGSRTYDLMGLSIRLAGFDIRDGVAWLNGQGFPKGGVDERGRGSALKPAFEPIVMARKPFRGSLRANLEEHGTGALVIDASRIGSEERFNPPAGEATNSSAPIGAGWREDAAGSTVKGRHPANVILDESQAAALDEQTGTLTSGKMKAGTKRSTRQGAALGEMPAETGAETIGDSGGASRFFKVIEDEPHFIYQAKAPKAERPSYVDGDGRTVAHSTVKPLPLIRYLQKMVTPAGGLTVDPFTGSGTAAEAAILEGFRFHGSEMTREYMPLILQRIERAS